MNLEQLRGKLTELRVLPTETEWAEFSRSKNERIESQANDINATNCPAFMPFLHDFPT